MHDRARKRIPIGEKKGGTEARGERYDTILRSKLANLVCRRYPKEAAERASGCPRASERNNCSAIIIPGRPGRGKMCSSFSA